MIKEFKNIQTAQNVYVWVIKQTTAVSKTKHGPKTATRQNIAAPLPTPMLITEK